MGSSWYQEHITMIKYWLLVINIFFMIVAIKAVVNHQLIVDSIAVVKLQTQQIEEKKDFTTNFLSPYLQSEFAPYFFAHENNQIFPWEKIIKLIVPSNESSIQTGSLQQTGTIWLNQQPNKVWNYYINHLISTITWWKEAIPFLH